jgi:hypothetical protein
MNNEIDLGIGIGSGNHEKIKTATVAVLEKGEEAVDPFSIADELGYEGSLAIDVLEERIRFYQRRTVEDAIELGKHLLLLKSVTNHGEFEERIEALGFSARSARRFMQAAGRVYKSDTVSLLAKRVKGIKGFLELLTLEDDDIQNILELDDLDRMSASQLRNLARKRREERDTLNTRLNTAEDRANRLMCGYAAYDPDMSKETVIARAYCMGAMKTAETKLEGLLRNFAQESRAETEDARIRLEQQWVAANIIAARAMGVIERMRELAPFGLPERVMGQHILTPDEAARWRIDARLIEDNESAEEALLHGQEPEKRGRGRPRKDATKA